MLFCPLFIQEEAAEEGAASDNKALTPAGVETLLREYGRDRTGPNGEPRRDALYDARVFGDYGDTSGHCPSDLYARRATLELCSSATASCTSAISNKHAAGGRSPRRRNARAQDTPALTTFVQMFRCVPSAPLGFPVVPEV